MDEQQTRSDGESKHIQTSTHDCDCVSRAVGSLVVLALVISILFHTVNWACEDRTITLSEPARIQSTSSIADIAMVFPEEGMDAFDDSEELADRIAGQLGLGDITPFSDNDHNLSIPGNQDDWENMSRPFWRLTSSWEYSTYHWWAKSTVGNSTLGLLYNCSDRLTEILAYPENPEMRSNGTTLEDFISVARNIAIALAVPSSLIPFENCTVTGWIDDWESDAGYASDSEVFRTVYLWGHIGDLEVFGANHIIVDFVDQTVFRVTVLPFFVGDLSQPGITGDEALGLAEEWLESKYDGQWMSLTGERKVVDGICLDEDTRDIVYITSLGFVLDGDEENGFTRVFNALIGAFDGARIDSTTVGGYTLPDENGGPLTITSLDLTPVMILTIALASAVIVTIALSWPPEHLVAIAAPLLILLTRIEKDELLINYIRGKIHGYILANPGTSLTEVKTALGLGNGTAMYHLNVLTRNGMIVQRRAGNLIRLYDRDCILAQDIESTWSDLQNDIVNYLRSNGQTTASEIRKGLDVSRQTLHHNLRKLMADGAVFRSYSRGRMRFRLADEIGRRMPDERVWAEQAAETGDLSNPDIGNH